jgi:hypothetical protein
MIRSADIRESRVGRDNFFAIRYIVALMPPNKRYWKKYTTTTDEPKIEYNNAKKRG